jgi:hypothetical protein
LATRCHHHGYDTFVATAVAEELAGALADVELEEVVHLVFVVGAGGARLHDELLAAPLPHEALPAEEVGDLIFADGEVGGHERRTAATYTAHGARRGGK